MEQASLLLLAMVVVAASCIGSVIVAGKLITKAADDGKREAHVKLMEAALDNKQEEIENIFKALARQEAQLKTSAEADRSKAMLIDAEDRHQATSLAIIRANRGPRNIDPHSPVAEEPDPALSILAKQNEAFSRQLALDEMKGRDNG